MKGMKVFRPAMLGIYLLFAVIAVSTSALCVYTVDKQLSSEYENNSREIAKTIASASEDILLNRDLATLQSLVDQFLSIPAIKYLYIADEHGNIIVHTFVPQIPPTILAGDRTSTVTIQRTLAHVGDVIEVGSPILEGLAGSVHVGMDKGLIALKIKTAIGKQVYLISILFIASIALTFLFVGLGSRPLRRATEYARFLAAPAGSGLTPPSEEQSAALLSRRDEAGDLVRVVRALASRAESGGTRTP